MSMFSKISVIDSVKDSIQKKLDKLPYKIEFNMTENESAKLWLISKNMNDFRNLCLQNVISQFVMFESEFCDYDISEQISIIKEFYDFVKIV